MLTACMSHLCLFFGDEKIVLIDATLVIVILHYEKIILFHIIKSCM